MAKLSWLVICEKAIIDRQNGSLSMIGVIEHIRVPARLSASQSGAETVLIPFRMSIVQLWSRSKAEIPETVHVRLQLKTPKGSTYGETAMALDLSQHRNARMVTETVGFPWAGEGTYVALVQASSDGRKWRAAGRQSFEVLLQSTATSDAPQT